jgi:uncharacterized BrkB/YihY/UPF0761 family membrane protein
MANGEKNILKSIWAVVAGFLTTVILSILTDQILEKTGLMKIPFDSNSNGFIGFVILYRTIFGLLGSYITAALAPNKPMRHVMIGAFIGLLLAILGTIAQWDVPPHWYPITLIILALPTAWLGGKLRTRQLS